MKRNKLKQMYYKDDTTFKKWKDNNRKPTEEYTRWVEDRLIEQLNLHIVSKNKVTFYDEYHKCFGCGGTTVLGYCEHGCDE